MKATPEQRLAKAFEIKRKGRSYDAIRTEVRAYLGDETPTEKTIIRYHRGTTEKPQVVVMLALCRVYGLDLLEIVPEWEPRVRTFTALCGPPDGPTRNFAYTSELPLEWEPVHSPEVELVGAA